LSDIHGQYAGFDEEEEEEEEDVSYHRPPAIKRTKPTPMITATASILGE
jgi:hypothetical protein